MLFSCVMISCRWLLLKEIHEDDIKYWKREIPRLMCEMKKNIPPTFFNAQEHCLIHQVEKIGTCSHKVNVDGGEALEIIEGVG
jgi:hypothetical protein